MEYKETNVIRHNQSFWNNAIEVTIIALIILTPLVFYPYSVRIFNPLKELAFEILVIIGLMFWALKITAKEEFKISSTPLNLPILAFMAICAISLLWSNSPMVSLLELPLFLTGPILYFIVANNIKNEHQINRLLNALLFISTLLGIYGIFQYQGIDFLFWRGNIGRQQVFGLLGNVNYFAEYLIVPLSLAISLFFTCQNRWYKILLLLGILAMGGSLILTFARACYLAIGISSIFMFILYLVSLGKGFIKEHKKIFIIILAFIILVIFLFVLPNPLNKPGTVISKIKSRISVGQLIQGHNIKRRIATWKFTGMMIKDHPLLGSGLGTFKYNSLAYQAKFFDQGKNRRLYPYGIADKAHNEYLQLGAEVGILGLGIFLWLLFSYFRYGIKLLKRVKDRYKQGIIIGLMGGIMAVLVDGIFNFPLHLPATIALFWLFIGLTMSINKKEMGISKNNPAKKDIAPFHFKPLLYIVIILLSSILCITLARPFIAQTYWYYGVKEIRNKNWNKAIKIYEKALKWNPYSGGLYYDIGKILIYNKIYTPAQEYLEKAEKYIDFPDLPQELAVIYLKNNMLDKAVVKLEQAISYQENEKSMVPMYNQLGSIYFRQKNYKQAEMTFENALEIDPNFVNSHYGLASVYLQQNRSEEALQELQKVIELAPDSKEANYAKITIQRIMKNK